MIQQVSDDLRVTNYCDHDHKSIMDLAGALAKTSGIGNPGAHDTGNLERLARLTILWVRDEIRFGLDLFKIKASETLQKGYGACYNKSLLLTALLRANGIPARFCSVPVNRWFMKPYFGGLCRLINNPFHHCLVDLELNGRRFLAEPTLDRASYDSLFRPQGVDWGIEWSTKHQDRLYLEHLQGEPQVHHDIDQTIGRNVGNSLLPTPIAKAFINRINKKAWERIDSFQFHYMIVKEMEQW